MTVAQSAPPSGGGSVSADPTNSQLPGAALFQTLINWVGWGALMASLAVVLVGGTRLWGWSQYHGNSTWAGKGKLAALGGAAGAIVVGLLVIIVNTLHSLAAA